MASQPQADDVSSVFFLPPTKRVMRIKLPPKTTIGVAYPKASRFSQALCTAAGDKLEPKAAKAFGPGSYFSIGEGKPIFAYTTDKQTILQLHGNGPWGIKYLDAKDATKTRSSATWRNISPSTRSPHGLLRRSDVTADKHY